MNETTSPNSRHTAMLRSAQISLRENFVCLQYVITTSGGKEAECHGDFSEEYEARLSAANMT